MADYYPEHMETKIAAKVLRAQQPTGDIFYLTRISACSVIKLITFHSVTVAPKQKSPFAPLTVFLEGDCSYKIFEKQEEVVVQGTKIRQYGRSYPDVGEITLYPGWDLVAFEGEDRKDAINKCLQARPELSDNHIPLILMLSGKETQIY